MPSVLAGELGEFRLDETGPVFQIRAIDYWAIQPALSETDATAKVRKVLEAGLLAIDGDEAAAKEFLERPSVRYVNPLFEAVWQLTWGN